MGTYGYTGTIQKVTVGATGTFEPSTVRGWVAPEARSATVGARPPLKIVA